MSKGTIFKKESNIFYDKKTHAKIRQVTDHPSINHHPFFTIPAYDNNMNRLFFVSHRTGKPQIFCEERCEKEIVQLTDLNIEINEWSVHPSFDGKYVYFTAGTGGFRVHTESLKEEKMFDFNGQLRDNGMVASAMGTTALSHDNRWWAVRYTDANTSCILIIDTDTGVSETILRRDSVSHMQFCPDDSDLLYYAGPLNDRVWLINRDGTGNRRLYERNKEGKEWITHESWIPGTMELAFVDWPKGIRCINVKSNTKRRITSFNAWHAACNHKGTMMIADTNFPDIGLQLFNPLDGVGKPKTLCYPQASSMGDHWSKPFPYDNGPIAVNAPQHTHPHPVFSPDGKLVVYTSDISGFAQVYEVEIAI
mgnify:CR=1 FL=1